MKNTTLTISEEVWIELVRKKESPKETFDDVLRRLLNLKGGKKDGN